MSDQAYCLFSVLRRLDEAERSYREVLAVAIETAGEKATSSVPGQRSSRRSRSRGTWRSTRSPCSGGR